MSTNSVNAIKKRVANASRSELLTIVRVGWELETQRCDGMRYDDCSETELDEELAAEYRDSLVNDALSNTISSILNVETSIANKRALYERISVALDALSSDHALYGETIHDITYDELEKHNIISNNDLNILRDRIEDAVTDEIEYPESCYVLSDRQFSLPNGLTCSSDCSVQGPEIKTDGPTTVSESMRLLRELFSKHTLEVDVGCSFHVHISVPGIKHSYSPEFQSSLYEYLMLSIDRVPASVKLRWISDKRKFFKPKLTRDKMSFVNRHQSLNTWEFRCFGNVNSLTNAMRCIVLAAEAIQYAYRKQLGLVNIVNMSANEVSELLDTTLYESGDVTELSKLSELLVKRVRIDRRAA